MITAALPQPLVSDEVLHEEVCGFSTRDQEVLVPLYVLHYRTEG